VELNAMQAIIQLFYLHRGLTFPEIFYLGIAWSLASLIFDIPTSFLADRWGKKKTIVLGVAVNILANLSLFFCFNFVSFFLNTFILSLSFSFFSGVEDAFLYETLKEMKQEGVVLKTSGKYAISTKASKLLTPLIGVLIAHSLSDLQFNIILSINLIGSVIAFLFAGLMIEPQKHLEVVTSRLRHLKDSFSILLRSSILKKITLNKTLIFIASFVFWKTYQKPLLDMGLSVFMLGVLYPVFNSISILVFSKTEYLFKKFDQRLIFDLPVWITLVGSLIFAVSQNKWLSFFLTIFLVITGVIREPFFTQQIQWRLKSQNRATTGSAIGFLKSLLDIPILLFCGYLASFSWRVVLLVPVFLSALTLIFFRLQQKDILLELPPKS
jgi:MFS family permease